MAMSRKVEEMVDLNDAPDHYAKVYQTYTQSSCCSTSQSDASKTDSVSELVAEACIKGSIQRLEAITRKPNPLKVLSVGSGDGEVDCAILKRLLPSFPKISNTVVEPSLSQLDHFRKRVLESGDALEGITFHWRQQTSDEYLDEITEGASQQSERTEDRFHLVTAIHMLYYVQDLKETINKNYDMLEEGGLLFIVITSRESASLRIWTKMAEYRGNPGRRVLTDADVRSELDNLNLPYSTGQIPLYTRAAAVFDKTSVEGNDVLDFMTHTKDFPGRKTN